MSADYLPVLLLQDKPLARPKLTVQRDIRNINIIARLDERIFYKSRPNVALGINLSLISTRHAARYINIAPRNLSTGHGAFNLDVARRFNLKTVVHVPAYTQRTVKLNIARRYAHGALYLKSRINTYAIALVHYLTIARGYQAMFAHNTRILAFRHRTRSTIGRRYHFAQHILPRRAFRLRYTNRQSLIFLRQHEQIQILIVHFVIFIHDRLATHAQIEFAVYVRVLAIDRH